MKVVTAKFPSGNQDYHYFVPGNDQPKVGDFIVTSYDHRKENPYERDNRPREYMGERVPHMALVVSIEEPRNPKATKPYLMLLARDELARRHELRETIMEDARLRKEARDRLKNMITEKRDMEIFKELAETNPEAKALLEILNAPPPSLVPCISNESKD